MLGGVVGMIVSSGYAPDAETRGRQALTMNADALRDRSPIVVTFSIGGSMHLDRSF